MTNQKCADKDYLFLFGPPAIRFSAESHTQHLELERTIWLLASLAANPGCCPPVGLGHQLAPQLSPRRAQAQIRQLALHVRQAMPKLRSLGVIRGQARWKALGDIGDFRAAVDALALNQTPVVRFAPFLSGVPIEEDAIEKWIAEERVRLSQRLEAAQIGFTSGGQLFRHSNLDKTPIGRTLASIKKILHGSCEVNDGITRNYLPEPARLTHRDSRKWQEERAPSDAVSCTHPMQTVENASNATDGADDNPVLCLRRDSEKTALLAVLASKAALVVICGIRGIGKTTLARSVYEEIKNSERNLVGWIDLSLQQPDQTILSLIGLVIKRGLPDDRDVCPAIADAKGVIFLDNFDPLAANERELSELIRQMPGVRFVVTARTLTGIPGELAITLGGIEFRGKNSAAAQLLGIRAGVMDRALQDADLHTVAELATLLEGVPLSIELSAAMLILLTPNAVLEEVRKDPLIIEALSWQPNPRVRRIFEHAWNCPTPARNISTKHISRQEVTL